MSLEHFFFHFASLAFNDIMVHSQQSAASPSTLYLLLSVPEMMLYEILSLLLYTVVSLIGKVIY